MNENAQNLHEHNRSGFVLLFVHAPKRIVLSFSVKNRKYVSSLSLKFKKDPIFIFLSKYQNVHAPVRFWYKLKNISCFLVEELKGGCRSHTCDTWAQN